MKPFFLSASLLAFFFAMPFVLFAQKMNSPEIVWQKCVDLYKKGKLDSAKEKVCYFNDQYHLYDTSLTFYTYLDTLKYSDGFFAVGMIILDPCMSFEGRKIGIWIYYYPSGKIFSRGVFEVGAYTECQAGGPDAVGYNFKSGTWSYWYDNGKLMTTGDYKRGKELMRTNCRLDTLYNSSADNSWKCYDKFGNQLPEKNTLILKINQGY
jgi:hypothetical protein